ncbi:MAG TPA: SCO family protein [Allosphingosinicella sp.]|nr:SCO family protein [Allosphingosinicella sp.]
MPKADRVIAEIRKLPRTDRGDRRLAAMLGQGAGHFDGLSTGDAERVRGHILAAFGEDRSSECALPAIREELRTSLSPIVLAGAARAARSLRAIDEEVRGLLLAASERIALRDEYVRFDGAPGQTAREEIAAALAARPRACCAGGAAKAADPVRFSLPPAAIERAAVEDQAGERTALAELLRRRTSLVAFFYTRCMNPAKCSLTITRLAGIAREYEERDLNLLGFSYDGAYDTPARLLAYGRDRGFPFGEHARLIRCRTGWSGVRAAFRLRVGYGQATVNDHARELFLVRPDFGAVGLDPEALADRAAIEAYLQAIAA